MTSQPTGRIRGNDLVLSRRFRASIEDVWTSITEPSSTARWFGRWEGKPGVGNEIRIQMGFEDGQPWLTKTIEACEPPHRLVLTAVNSSVTSRLELGLKAIGDGCELEFVHHAIRSRTGRRDRPGLGVLPRPARRITRRRTTPTFDTYYPAQKAYFLGLTSGSATPQP